MQRKQSDATFVLPTQSQQPWGEQSIEQCQLLLCLVCAFPSSHASHCFFTLPHSLPSPALILNCLVTGTTVLRNQNHSTSSVACLTHSTQPYPVFNQDDVPEGHSRNIRNRLNRERCTSHYQRVSNIQDPCPIYTTHSQSC